MTTEEGNKIIAEFTGNAFADDWHLKYHSSWDWLMPVVEKCKTVKLKKYDYDWWLIHSPLINVQIKSTWLAVIEFINWYNNNK